MGTQAATTGTTRTTTSKDGTGRGRSGRSGGDRRGSSPEERAARLAAVHAALADAVAAAATDAGWAAWLGAAARFRTYSPTNQLLILLQRPGATRVAGYRVWQRLGRQVRKGEQGIRILAPINRRIKADADTPTPESASETGQRVGEQGATGGGRVLVGFTTATVFDLAQTDGDPLPARPRAVHPEGEAPAGLWEALAGQVTGRGFTLTREDPTPAVGLTDFTNRRVLVTPGVSPAMACHVLAHELGHITADHATRQDVPRGVREAEADGIAHLITTAAGIDGRFAVDYVTGWSQGDAALVRATQSRVVAMAAQLVEALGLDPDPEPDPERAGPAGE